MTRILTIEWPLMKLPEDAPQPYLRCKDPRRRLFHVTTFRVDEFGGSLTNTTKRLWVLGRLVATLQINLWEDKSAEKKAKEYLAEWCKAEKREQALRDRNTRLMYLLEDLQARVKGTTLDPDLAHKLDPSKEGA